MKNDDITYSGRKLRQVVTLEITWIEAFDGYPAAPSEWHWEPLVGEDVRVLASGPVEELTND